MGEADRPRPGEESRSLGRRPQEELSLEHDSLERPLDPRIERRFRIERRLGAAAMLLLCIITLGNVAVRYLTDYSFAFTEEVSIFLIVFVTLVGSAKAFIDGGQIAVTWFVERFFARRQRGFRIFSLACSAAMMAILAWYGTRMAWDDYELEVTSPGLGSPQWLYTVWLPLLALLILARVLQGIWDVLREGRA